MNIWGWFDMEDGEVNELDDFFIQKKIFFEEVKMRYINQRLSLSRSGEATHYFTRLPNLKK